MMGPTHAASGPVLALIALPAINSGLSLVGFEPLSGWSLLPFCVAVVAGAVLPDIDMPQSTIARSLGPVTRLPALAIEKLSGGHREGTHSLLGVAFFTALTWAVSRWSAWTYALWVLFMFAVGSAAMFKEFRKGSVVVHTLTTLAIGGALFYFTGTAESLPVYPIVTGIAVGVLIHLIGDMLTKQGVPLLWPMQTRFKVANRTSGSPSESLIYAGLLLALPFVAAWRLGYLSAVLAHVGN